MLGKPKYNYGDFVSFECDNRIIKGQVYIIDKWGTFADDSDVSYDIMGGADNEPKCLYKHVNEKYILE